MPSQTDKSPQTTFVQRTLVLRRPSGALARASLALALQAKNLYNTALFAARQVLTAYEKSGEGWALKRELHVHQLQALHRFNVVIDRLNLQRQAKFEALKAQGGEKADKAKLTLLPRLDEQVASVYRSVLDVTVLDNVLREWPGADGEAVYRRLPAKTAQLVIHRLRDAWSGYFESLKTFTAGGAAMTGRPMPPSYLAKKDRFVVELPLTQVGATLIGLGERVVPVDFEETVALTESELAAWNGYRIGDEVGRACAARGFGTTAQPQHLRIVPHKGGVKFEVVVRVPRTLPEGSLLARLEAAHELPENVGKRNAFLLSALGSLDPALQRLRGAALDPGVTNTATLAFSTGHRAQVISGGRLERVLGKFDQRIDALVSRLTCPRARELQGKKAALQDKGEKLPRAEHVELNKLLKNLYADPQYRKLRAERERWLKDYAHKLTHGVVRLLQRRGIEVLVLGQNKGWKDGSEMGRTQNRRFGRIPHSWLIELLRYKAEALGIVVVTTEESYTSKTSFVANEPLKQHKSVEAAAPATSSNPECPATEPQGKRLKHERHTFVNLNQTGRWARVHADVNGAFNILRKALKSFVFHAKLTLAYRILRVSPRLGLTPVRI